jgi:hypothetical protein
MKNIRNKKCECGSGVKYKTCCMDMLNELKKIEMKSLIQEYQKYDDKLIFNEFSSTQNNLTDDFVLELPNFKKEDFPNCIETKVSKGIFDLPSKSLWKIDKVLKRFKMDYGRCYHNSFILSSYIDEVDKVVGWIGHKGKQHYECQVISSLNSDIDILITPHISNNPQSDNDYMIHDKKSDNYFIRHSWNRVGEFHFDSTPTHIENLKIKYVRHTEDSKPYTLNDMRSIHFGLGLDLVVDIFNKKNTWGEEAKYVG